MCGSLPCSVWIPQLCVLFPRLGIIDIAKEINVFREPCKSEMSARGDLVVTRAATTKRLIPLRGFHGPAANLNRFPPGTRSASFLARVGAFISVGSYNKVIR